MTGITSSQIQGLVRGIRNRAKSSTSSRFIGISTPYRLMQEGTVEVDGQDYAVAQCVSELHIRDVLGTAADDAHIVVVTPLADADVGEDLLLRFFRRSLRTLDTWENAMNIYSAVSVDGRVRKHKWIAEALLEAAALGEQHVAPNGLLTAEFAWERLLESMLGLKCAQPDVQELLLWSHFASSGARVKALSEEQLKAVSDWLRLSAGKLAEVMLHVLRITEGSPLVMGLACEVIYAKENRAGSKLSKAEIRLETFTNIKDLDRKIAQDWGLASCALVRSIGNTQPDVAADAFKRLKLLLHEVEADAHMALSSVLPEGFEKRIHGYARALLKALDDASVLQRLPAMLDGLREHRQAELDEHRLDRAEMATRLVRYVHAAQTGAIDSFASAVSWYVSSGAYADWARTVLYSGESNQKVAQIYNRILEAVADMRHEQNRAFAERFCEWTKQGSVGNEVIGVENVLHRAAKPAAEAGPLLFIVLDGMSHAVFYELLESLTTAWSLYDDKDGTYSPTVAATIPSVTVISRSSLLSGRLVEPPEANEKKGFVEALKTGTQNKPILFHKKDLATSGGAALSPAIFEAINSPRRIVGAVVNAIDDDLDKGDQVVTRWNLESLSLLDMLLAAAAESGRRVMLASDHGHILDRGTELRESGENNGERNRMDDGSVQPGELLFEGHRVLKGPRRLIVPWDERVRYKKKKNGYHGGVTPQEILVPLALLAQEPETDWIDRVPQKPDWWYIGEAPLREPVTKTVATVAPELKEVATLPLFVDAPEAVEEKTVETEAWIGEFLASPLYKAQKKLAVRNAPGDERVALFLEVLSARGGRCLRSALAQSMKMPAMRLPGLISSIQRLLNVDGYQAVSLDSGADTVILNMEILTTQFELKTND